MMQLAMARLPHDFDWLNNFRLRYMAAVLISQRSLWAEITVGKRPR